MIFIIIVKEVEIVKDLKSLTFDNSEQAAWKTLLELLKEGFLEPAPISYINVGDSIYPKLVEGLNHGFLVKPVCFHVGEFSVIVHVESKEGNIMSENYQEKAEWEGVKVLIYSLKQVGFLVNSLVHTPRGWKEHKFKK